MVEMLAAAVAVATAELLDGRGRRRPAHFLLFPVPDEGPDSAADDSVELAADGNADVAADDDDEGPDTDSTADDSVEMADEGPQHSAADDDDDGSHGASDSNGSTVCTQNKLC